MKRILRNASIKAANANMTRNLDVAVLRTFVTAADHASMTVAGNVLNLTQSAVSQQIARLESLAGPVFMREHRGIKLTATGERLLTKARRLLGLNDELWHEMTPTSLKTPVRLGAPHDLTGTWLVSILKDFAQAHPLVDIALTCAASQDLLQCVADGIVDLALIEEPAGPTRGTCLMVDRLVWVGAKCGVAYLKTPLPISLVADTCNFRPVVLEALSANGMTWRSFYDSGSTEATNAMVRADLAVTAWLASTVPDDLALLPPDAGLPDLPCFAVNLHWSKGQATLAAIELGKHIQHGLIHHRVAA